MPPKQLDPCDDDPGTPDHDVERFEGLLLAGRELRQPLHQELKVGIDRTEIDVLGITSWHEGVVIIWHGDRNARGWLTSGYDEGRKALPVNGNPSLGVTNSPPLGSGHHHVGIMASADGTDEAIGPIGNGTLGAVSSGHFDGIRLNVMATRLAPHDQANMGSRGISERHCGAGIGFHRRRYRPARGGS